MLITSIGSLIILVPLTLFFLYKVISSSTKNSPSARVMRNLTQAAREVPLYFRVHVTAPLSSFPSGPLSYTMICLPCHILISYRLFVLLSVLPSILPPLHLHLSGMGHWGHGWGWIWAQLHSELPHAQFSQSPAQPSHALVCSSHSMSLTHISNPRGSCLPCNASSSPHCCVPSGELPSPHPWILHASHPGQHLLLLWTLQLWQVRVEPPGMGILVWSQWMIEGLGWGKGMP